MNPMRDYRERRTQQGLCRYCGQISLPAGAWQCRTCRKRQRQYYVDVTRPRQLREREQSGPPLLACCGKWHVITAVPFLTPCCGRSWFIAGPAC